jgi:hypothetical protein
MNYAVITGDIEKSTQLHPQQKTNLMKHLASALNTWNVGFEMQSEIYRGDSFQCVLKKPKDALRVALIIKTYLRNLNIFNSIDRHQGAGDFSMRSMEFHNDEFSKSIWLYDARIAIGIGAKRVFRRKISTSDGEAFVRSGRILDSLKNRKQEIGIETGDSYNSELQTEIVLLDAIISKTSALQCEVIYLKLLGYKEIDISKRLSINQSAVNQRSNAANWNAINTMVERFEIIYGTA